VWISVLNIVYGKVTRLLEYPLVMFSASEEPVTFVFIVEEVSPTGVIVVVVVVIIIIIVIVVVIIIIIIIIIIIT